MTAIRCLGLALVALAGCGGESDKPAAATPRPDAALQRLERACAEHRAAARAELPPRSLAEYAPYAREQRRLVLRLVDAIEAVPAEGAIRVPRGQMLAGASSMLTTLNHFSPSTADGLYQRGPGLWLVGDELDDAADDAGLRCGRPAEVSAGAREFRRRAGAICDESGRPQGTPDLDAELIAQRARDHAELPLPAEAGELERATLATERDLAEVAATNPREGTAADARYVALAVRTSEGWRRQTVDACVDVPIVRP